MSILVTGGAGYIGSHTAIELLNSGREIVILDNFSNSKPEVLENIKKITGKDFKFYEVNYLDRKELEKVFDGWQTKETDEEGNETLVDVDENYKPEDNTDNELVAKWKEQEKTEDTANTTIEDNGETETTTSLDLVEEETPVVEETVPEAPTIVETAPEAVVEATM